MVERLFEGRTPSAESRILDPGCGDGAFIDGVLRWCQASGVPTPQILGVELHPGRSAQARARFAGVDEVRVETADFLRSGALGALDYVIGNPPYVAITGLGEAEKSWYRSTFRVASGRFDLYALFWEQALRFLKPGGRLVFITPEKFLTVEAARPLRQLLASRQVPEVRLLPEDTFRGLTTYPAVTTVDEAPPAGRTLFVLRDGKKRSATFGFDGASLAPTLYGSETPVEASSGALLGDICSRISCGVATGADGVFVRPMNGLALELRPFARPTVSGRQLVPGTNTFCSADVMLMPYDGEGRLLPPSRLEALGDHLQQHRAKLEGRTCAARKPWYAFHETPPLAHLLRPKLLCKDVTEEPYFWADREGAVVPRHSVYYVVPHDPRQLDDLEAYLNGPEAREWLRAHSQRARKGFLRLQASVLKRLPLPYGLAAVSPVPRLLLPAAA